MNNFFRDLRHDKKFRATSICCGLNYRNTFYNPANAFKMFLRQALQPFCSCRQAINKVRKESLKAGKPVAKTDTGNYCKSRKKIR